MMKTSRFKRYLAIALTAAMTLQQSSFVGLAEELPVDPVETVTQVEEVQESAPETAPAEPEQTAPETTVETPVEETQAVETPAPAEPEVQEEETNTADDQQSSGDDTSASVQDEVPATNPDEGTTPEETVTPSPEAEPTVSPEAVEPGAEEGELKPEEEQAAVETPEEAEPAASIDEAKEALAVKVSVDQKYAVAGTLPILYKVEISGGKDPKQVQNTITVNGKVVYSSDEEKSEISYMPQEFGEHTLTVKVTDADGKTVIAEAACPVAVNETNSALALPSLEATLTYAERLLKVAVSQIGYQESTRNFIIDDDGKKQGYTAYGAWYGSGTAYSEWCAMFVSYCLTMAGIPQDAIPIQASCSLWKTQLGTKYIDDEDNYVPEAGDIIFFHHDSEKEPSDANYPNHVGIVEKVDDLYIYTIEGNSNKSVERLFYGRADSRIVGFVSMRAIMKEYDGNYKEEEEEEEETQTTVSLDGDKLTVVRYTDQEEIDNLLISLGLKEAPVIPAKPGKRPMKMSAPSRRDSVEEDNTAAEDIKFAIGFAAERRVRHRRWILRNYS